MYDNDIEPSPHNVVSDSKIFKDVSSYLNI